MTFGERLHTVRQDANLSQEKLAEKLSVSKQTVYRWESDKNFPDINQLKALCQIFAVQPQYFMDGDTDKQDEEQVKPRPSKVKRRLINFVLYLFMGFSLLCIACHTVGATSRILEGCVLTFILVATVGFIVAFNKKL